MPFDLIISIIQVSLLFLLNIVATYSSLKTTFALKPRRYIQLTAIWLIPLIGAVIAMFINQKKYAIQKNPVTDTFESDRFHQ